VVDWRYCVTGDPTVDIEAPGTHIGLVFNPSVYTIIAKRLADASVRERTDEAMTPATPIIQ
jgi:hypothetical protein